jgi:hypothetical protein
MRATQRNSRSRIAGPPHPTTGMGPPRALNLPRPARVRVHDSCPCEVNGDRVEAVRESWLVEDRWWAEQPLRRRYWELVSARGRNLIVFHDLCADGWFTQGS